MPRSETALNTTAMVLQHYASTTAALTCHISLQPSGMLYIDMHVTPRFGSVNVLNLDSGRIEELPPLSAAMYPRLIVELMSENREPPLSRPAGRNNLPSIMETSSQGEMEQEGENPHRLVSYVVIVVIAQNGLFCRLHQTYS